MKTMDTEDRPSHAFSAAASHPGSDSMVATDFSTHRFRVLLVEDCECTLKLVQSLLQKCGYDVTLARNGREALDVLNSLSAEDGIDLILTDILMPEVSGMELMCEILADERWSKTPVIVMSSEEGQDTVMRAFAAGARDYLIKPVRRNELTMLWQHVWRGADPRVAAGVPVSRNILASDEATVNCMRGSQGGSTSGTEQNSVRYWGSDSRAPGKAAFEAHEGESAVPANISGGRRSADPAMPRTGYASELAISGQGDTSAGTFTRVAASIGTDGGTSISPVYRAADEQPIYAAAEGNKGEVGEVGKEETEEDSSDMEDAEQRGQGDSSTAPLDLAPHASKAERPAVQWSDGQSGVRVATVQLPQGLLELVAAGERLEQEARDARQSCEDIKQEVANDSGGDSNNTAFHHGVSSAFTAFVPRPCSRGDALVAQKVQVLAGGWPGAWLAQGGPVSGDVDPELQQTHQFFVAFQAAVGHHTKGADQCTLARRVAIAKFRAKRKARNFDKKVRYESRKRLAESRPRIKGQFVTAEVAAAYYASQVGKDESTD